MLVLCLSSVPSASWAIDSEPIWAGGTIVKYLCDFAEGCLLSFRLNTGMEKKKQGAWHLARCQLRAQVQTYPWMGGFLVLCENQGGRVGRFCNFD